MKRNITINDLSSIRTRNLVRGLISAEDATESVRLIKKIRATSSEQDFHKVLEILRTSAIFKNNAIGRDFNKTFPRIVGKRPIYSLDEICGKIDKNKSKLIFLTELAAQIVSSIAALDWQQAVNGCRALAGNEGVSIFLLRVLHFIRARATEDPDVPEAVDTLLLEVGLSNVRYLSLAIKELSSEKTDFFNICEKIHGLEESLVSAIARSFVDHIPRTYESFLETLVAYYYISVFDAFVYLCGTNRLELPFVPAVPEGLISAYKKLSKIEVDPSRYYDTWDPYVGIDYFRESFLLIEVESFFNFRTLHAAVFNRQEAKDIQRIPFERRLLNQYYSKITEIRDIGIENANISLRQSEFNKHESCHFQNSCALVYLLEKRDGDIGEDQLGFVRLMSLTRDIGLICPPQYIEAVGACADIPELKIVVTCLSHIRQKSQLKEHELRAVIQETAVLQFAGKLTDLVGYIYDISPAVAEHLILTADETFLSKLFQIIKNPNAAIEERANILEWYGNLTADSAYIERAKNLRIDVQISREKGTIDDSRIYVDPVRFTQWVNDQVIDDISLLLEVIPQQPELTLVSLNWDKVKTGMTAHDQIGSLLLKCYEEFCTNKIFGIASYLGRRIRHGTLKGTGFSDVNVFAKDVRYKNLFANKEFDDAFRVWVKEYESTLDKLRDSFLHVHDKKKPEGMIFRDFRSVNKRNTANHMLHDITKSFKINKTAIELPYIITEYCWRLIEEDLAAIRKFLMEQKAKYAVFRFESGYQGYLRHREVQEFCQELNSLTAEKFRIISSWFNKPSIASPSADITLLFRAVVSEIRGFFQDYNPRIEVENHEYTLNGGAYFVIYDALYILIYNAAKYGKKDGVLSMVISPGAFPNKIGVNISIRSQLEDGTRMEDVERSISMALEGDCEDALIVEGRSGIKKLRRMEQTGYIGGVAYHFEGDSVIASFNFGIDYQS
ncbi:hypothetical protein [Cupriavidus sp. HPC(L)]|uniref:hypothetical protein n=1 Tax=Cupriavidus sp. HPC(L) TaxID=1217418 RepID=UPI0002F30534|nr:hypothetical protein [Cupriavidus sp. HPC(L)]